MSVCKACEGSGFNANEDGSNVRDCEVCHGNGRGMDRWELREHLREALSPDAFTTLINKTSEVSFMATVLLVCGNLAGADGVSWWLVPIPFGVLCAVITVAAFAPLVPALWEAWRS